LAVVFVTDIGNTSVSWGVFDEDRPLISGTHRHAGVPSRAVAAVLGNMAGKNPSAVGVSGVVPEITLTVWKEASATLDIPVLRYRTDFQPGIELGIDRPDAAGDDRIAGIRAAYSLSQGAAVCVHAGTAVTIDVVTDTGTFVGGAILPGIQMALDALHSGTALLPRLKPDRPITAIGSDTQQALLSGCVLGTARAADALIKAMRKERSIENCPVYLTGGDADLLNEFLLTAVQKVPHLTLLGVALDLQAAMAHQR